MASGNSGAAAADRAARARDAAVADALDEAARVLVRLAARLRVAHDSAAADRPPTPRRQVRSEPRSAEPAVPQERVPQLGPRQRAVLGLGGLADELGLAASEVAKALGFSPANATNILKRLETLEFLRRVPDERPARWRTARLLEP